MSPAAEPQPHYHVSGPEQALHGPENKDITLLLSLDLTPEQLQSYYDGHFKDAKVPTVERAGAMQSYLPRYTHLRASIDCGDGQVISCKAMEGYPPDIPTVPGVMMWRWNVVGIDDGKATGPRAQAVRIVVLGAGDAAGPYERIDSIPDIPLQVKVDALTTAERLIAAWTHLADSIKALLVAVIAAIGVLTAWLRSTFKKKEPPAAG
ncbi:MAG: hypothetical protein JWR16_1961 [Nevskia sp.]|nr:hypothetical protein [Nevskia sp.]